MRKRSRESLTGGTGDVNPQWFAMSPITTLGAGYTEGSTVLPRERLPYGNKSQVMEVLKVQFIRAPNQTDALTAATFASIRFYITTSSFGTTEPTSASFSGKIVAYKRYDVFNVAASVTSVTNGTLDDLIDCTDGAGHGILVATDAVFVGGIEAGVTVAANASVSARILYRWKNVSLQEYIGIVSSQQ